MFKMKIVGYDSNVRLSRIPPVGKATFLRFALFLFSTMLSKKIGFICYFTYNKLQVLSWEGKVNGRFSNCT